MVNVTMYTLKLMLYWITFPLRQNCSWVMYHAHCWATSSRYRIHCCWLLSRFVYCCWAQSEHTYDLLPWLYNQVVGPWQIMPKSSLFMLCQQFLEMWLLFFQKKLYYAHIMLKYVMEFNVWPKGQARCCKLIMACSCDTSIRQAKRS